MKLVTVSTALRTALLWLLNHLKPSEQPSEQALISYGAEIERQRHTPPLLFIPAIYEPPEKTTDPTQEIHQLVQTGRITALIHTKKLPTVKGLHKTILQPASPQEDGWLLDAEPIEPEPESKDPEDTEHGPIAKLYKESRYGQRGKAS